MTLPVSCHARGVLLVKQEMTENLEALRRHGFGVAYRMLGTVADAEDVAQDPLARLARVDEELDEPAAWVTTVTTRLAIDHLRRERVRRKRYIGPWLPEPLLGDMASALAGPAETAEFAESLSQARAYPHPQERSHS